MGINNFRNIGIDLIDKRRFEIENIPFINRVLTSNELNIFNSLKSNNSKISFLSSRWSSKEAIYKALNKNDILFTKIEILNDREGKPFCSSHKNIILSISHSELYTISIAINLK